MSNKHFYSHITADHWTAKNKAEKEAKELAKSMDHTLINQDAEKFIRKMAEGIQEINIRNNRCKPLYLDIDFDRMGKDGSLYQEIMVYVSGVFSMGIYEVQHHI